MTQFSELTPSAKTIVVNFYSLMEQKNMFDNISEKLMVSLYSIMPGADKNVISILDKYNTSLSDYMPESDIEILKKEYPAVVKYCFDYRNSKDAINSAKVFVPQTLVDLCMRIAKPRSGSSVYVPYSGIGDFAYHVADCEIEGFEKNESLWAISQILLHSQKVVANIDLENFSIQENKQYDYIFSFPPIDSEDKCYMDGIVEMMYNLIIKHLSDNGELCCILPQSFCWSSLWKNVRKILLDYKGIYSATVIALPYILNTKIDDSLCVFIVKKNRKNAVVLVDADSSGFYAKTNISGKETIILKPQSVIESILTKDKKVVWMGPVESLKGGAIDLRPSTYLHLRFRPKLNEGEECYRINQLAVRLPLEYKETISSKCLEYPIIGMNELSSSYLNCDINRETLMSTESARKALSSDTIKEKLFLTSDCLLVGFMGGEFKVGRLSGVSPETPVLLINKTVTPIKLNTDKISEEFFLRSIMSKETKRQAKYLSKGNGWKNHNILYKIDLSNIVINVPSIDKQNIICKEESKKSLIEADCKLLELYEDFRKDIHMKKHAIGQTLFTLSNWCDALQRARMEGNGILDDNAMIGKIHKLPVTSIYDGLQNAISQLQQQISRFDRGNGLYISAINLPEFIENYICCKKDPHFEFRYEYNPILDDSESNEIQMVAKFAHEALEIIFDNIVSNACCHGFKGRSDGNIIKIELQSEGDKYVIIVSNNGAPMHSQIQPKDVFIYGTTSEMGKGTGKGETHFGIGGYEIQNLMREFGGNAEVISNPDTEYPVSYKLTFYNTEL